MPGQAGRGKGGGGDCLSNGTHCGYFFEGGRVEVDGWSGQWVKAFRGNEALTDALYASAKAGRPVRVG